VSEFKNKAEIYAFMVEREVKSCGLYRYLAQSVAGRQAKTLLERLAQKEEQYRQKLEESKKSGVFTNKRCNLPDNSFFKTIYETPASPGQTLPQILMFAIKTKHDDYLACNDAASHCQEGELRKLWLALAEEERINRLELESFYEKEVISKI